MKKFTYTLFAAAAGLFALSSCVKEAVEVGEPENDSYGVYFETLTSAQKSVELDPSEDAVVTFTAYREKEEDKITVPVVLSATYEGEKGTESARELFYYTDIIFEDGQTETTFEVGFPNAVTGTEYTCSVECVDKEYVHIYSDKPTSITFSVTRVKWNRLTGANGEEYGSWTDDIVAYLFGMKNYTNDRVEIYERSDKPGYYRIKDAYGTHMLWYMFGGRYSEEDLLENTTPGTYTFVDATDPAKVYIIWGTTGSTISSDGYIWIGSFCSENGFTKGKAYGTMSNGVIKFPADGLVIGFDDAPYTYGGSGNTTIVLPGCKDNDYSLEVEAGQSAEGKLPVNIKIGADVAKARYAVYEGTIADADASFAALDVSRDETAEFVTETSTVDIELDETGVYSIVVAALNAGGDLVDYEIVKFSYVKSGDSQPVVLGLGINSAERYVGQGYSTDNTVEIWCYGTDIVEARIAVVKKVDYLSDPDACIETVAGTDPVSDEVLEAINGDGYAAPVTKLLPGTPYKFVVIASNGYETEVFVTETEVTTTGDPLPIYEDYTAGDIDDDLLPETSEGYFGKYNFYAVDHYGSLGLREYISKVTIADSEIPDSEPDEDGLIDEYVEVSGIFSSEITDFLKLEEPFEDTMIWDCYGGVLYYLAQDLGAAGNYWAMPWIASESQGLYTPAYNNLIVGGFVKDGYIAFVCEPGYASYGYDFNGIALMLYKDEEYSSTAGVGAWYEDLLLVDETKDDNGVAPSAAKTAAVTAKLHNVAALARTLPANCVETPKGRIRSVIDAANAQKKVNLRTAEPSVFGTPVANRVSFTSTAAPGIRVLNPDVPVQKELKVVSAKMAF